MAISWSMLTPVWLDSACSVRISVAPLFSMAEEAALRLPSSQPTDFGREIRQVAGFAKEPGGGIEGACRPPNWSR